VATSPGRLLRALRRDGPVTFLRKAVDRLRPLVYLRESHIWYGLPVAGERPRRELPDGFALRPGTAEDSEHRAGIPGQPGADGARERLAGSAEMFLVCEGDRPAFACWIFSARTPVAAARGGWLELPSGTVCLEDSGTHPDFRGRGLAPAAWTALADEMARRGLTTMITKVEEENVSSRRAVVKAGFREGALMRTHRTGLVTHVAMSPLPAGGVQFLIEQLAR
jgi:GNAT superfamily N-acetyltransferase